MLFMSLKIVEHMTWHHSHDIVDEVMVYPFDGKAWKHFNREYPRFSMELKNMRLELCTNKFDQFSLFVAPYYCWSVILTIYNLSLGMCMRSKFIF